MALQSVFAELSTSSQALKTEIVTVFLLYHSPQTTSHNTMLSISLQILDQTNRITTVVPTTTAILRYKQLKGRSRKVTGRVSAIWEVTKKGWCSNGGKRWRGEARQSIAEREKLHLWNRSEAYIWHKITELGICLVLNKKKNLTMESKSTTDNLLH